MNILTEQLPTSVIINDERYEINSDFRTSIKFELIMQRDDIEEDQKIKQGLILYYPIIPKDLKKAIEKIKWFYERSKNYDTPVDNANKNYNNEKIYSFDYDDDYIYSAFLSQYGVDLNDIEYLHWWKFKAMFKALKDDNKMVKIMEYRSVNLSDIKDKQQKDFYKKMKKIYDIPMSKSESDKFKEINKILLNGGDISKVL